MIDFILIWLTLGLLIAIYNILHDAHHYGIKHVKSVFKSFTKFEILFFIIMIIFWPVVLLIILFNK